jgi:hypothetical protein
MLWLRFHEISERADGNTITVLKYLLLATFETWPALNGAVAGRLQQKWPEPQKFSTRKKRIATVWISNVT